MYVILSNKPAKLFKYTFTTMLFSAIEITDIRLEPVNQNFNTTHEGVVLLKTGGGWYSVCKDGFRKDWGKKEAMVACRQLQYEGGWPIDVDRMADEYSSQSFADFDCSWCKYNTNLETKQEELASLFSS